jgi:Gpi18-like mannosyltransferase
VPEGAGTGATGTARAAASTRADWLRALAFCTRVYLAVRVGLFLAGMLAVALLPAQGAVQVPGYRLQDPSAGWHALFTAWERWDVLWYLRIAHSGYADNDGSAAFFPLYPLLSRGVAHLVGGHWLLAAYLVSNVSLLVALVLLYRLSTTEFSETVARRVVVYLCVFPTGLFLFAPYTESLFLALTLGCLYSARQQIWPLAGYLGMMASLCRSTGLLLAVPLAVEAALQWRKDRRDTGARTLALVGRLAASGATGLGTGAYLLYWRFRGDWHRPLSLQHSYWGKESSWPWETVWIGVKEGARSLGTFAGGYATVDALITLGVLATGVWVTLRVRSTYAF